MKLDIVPFALPNCLSDEIRFEEPRDISEIRVNFANTVPRKLNVSYLRKTWPDVRLECARDIDNPCWFGWIATDDWFNCSWQQAKIIMKQAGKRTVSIQFKPLSTEFKNCKDYDVRFRRTLGIKLHVPERSELKKVCAFTTSAPHRNIVKVFFDAGKKTRGRHLRLSGYNAHIRAIKAGYGIRLADTGKITLVRGKDRWFEFLVEHMIPAHSYSNDDGLITFIMEHETFTISMTSLRQHGSIWFADEGIFITAAEHPVSFNEYKELHCSKLTISEMVLARKEQTLAGATYGQPRPHPVSYNLGCKHARQRFWLESNGDILLNKQNVIRIKGKDTERYHNAGSARFFFGLERWQNISRFPDPAPVLAYTIQFRNQSILLEQKSFAVPLLQSILDGSLSGDDTIVAMVRFQFTNVGSETAEADLSIKYSQDSKRSFNALPVASGQNDYLVPQSELDMLSPEDSGIYSEYKGTKRLRCVYATTMENFVSGTSVLFRQNLVAGETCVLVLKIPFITLESREEIKSLTLLDFEKQYKDVAEFWRREATHGASIRTPVRQLEELHRSHLAHVFITDFNMPDDNSLINTSVGTSTYGNFSNESCMIIHDLDERGLHDEARRRLDVWLRYQGTAPQPGNFTDFNGMFYGAGGFEDGAYNQHHGWVLWCLCEHLFHSGDKQWFASIADSVIAGADWVFRQRRNTMQKLPHSRGWEYGFLPAGSLEDVTDFHYWLSTNVLTWRGVEWVARALEFIRHPESHRIRCEADAYRSDLMTGFKIMRQLSPLVRLRNGRWIPHFPSRLYHRGRDIGWIREVLEGGIYLLIAGLYPSDSWEAEWILDDYQDTKYVSPPYGYQIVDFETNWYDRGGFSMQPNLLAGLMPYLERDEPELYLWMFFNAWSACYREEINAMIEHPAPVLGYSNSAHFKTSDEANAVSWLRYMFVYTSETTLHLGRAIPREWFSTQDTIYARNVVTRFGKVNIEYSSDINHGLITARVEANLRIQPERILVRFRHPRQSPIQRAVVNGKPHNNIDIQQGDVILDNIIEPLIVQAYYGTD